MRAALLTGIVALAFATSALAKGETKEIRIASEALASRIVITDPTILGRFNVWTGSGTGGAVNEVAWKTTEGGFVVGSSTPVDLEGRWYPASRAWQDAVTPLIK
jgi:hypothetical protein